jgi:F-type H+-transporting ATPase subunit alpha
MTDGQILLSSSLFTRGFKPAIDCSQSVSIIGSRAQCPALKELAHPLRMLFTKYNQLIALTKIKTTLSSEAEITLKRGEALSELFSQERNASSPLAEQIILLYALNKGLLDDLNVGRIKYFKNNVLFKLKKAYPRMISELSSGNMSLSDAVKETLDKFLADFLKAATAS